MKPIVINQINQTVNEGISKDLLHLFTEDQSFDGRYVTVKGKRILNFQSCSYLGLEIDDRLKKSSIDAVKKYGAQLSCSRTYLSCGLYREYEDLIQQVFGPHTLVSPTTSLGHSCVIPLIMQEGDLVVFDQQAHISMQDMIPQLKYYGVDVELIKHNSVDMLRRVMGDKPRKSGKIWYVFDGIYSMFGDVSPLDELKVLMTERQDLWLYCDDAHGMSWTGYDGSGYVRSILGKQERMVLAVSLAKAAGSAGGVFNFSDPDMCAYVKSWGKALSWSGPQQPAVIAANVASLKIHVTPEIYQLQEELSELIEYTHQQLLKYALPVVSDPVSPIFYLGLGTDRVAINLVKRMKEAGFLCDLAIYPAVSESKSGLRFCINRNLSREDIDLFVRAISHHFPAAMAEEGRSVQDITRAFREFSHLKQLLTSKDVSPDTGEIELQVFRSVEMLGENLWNKYLASTVGMDFQTMRNLEQVFDGNSAPEHNWKFKYYLVKDGRTKDPLLLSTHTTVLIKDDLLSAANASEKIEKIRSSDPYYLTTRCQMMGNLLSYGSHLWIDRESKRWKGAVASWVDQLWLDKKSEDAGGIMLRNFKWQGDELVKEIASLGFASAKIPPSYEISLGSNLTYELYINALSSSKRRYVQQQALNKEESFEVVVQAEVALEDIMVYERLYQNVKRKALEINDFPLPSRFFEETLSKRNSWEVIELRHNGKLVGFSAGYLLNETYNPTFLGIDYSQDLGVYNQLLWQCVKRSIDLNADRLLLGVSTAFNKMRFGAQPVQQWAMVQFDDHYNYERIKLLEEEAIE